MADRELIGLRSTTNVGVITGRGRTRDVSGRVCWGWGGGCELHDGVWVDIGIQCLLYRVLVWFNIELGLRVLQNPLCLPFCGHRGNRAY